jgi:hypothetical protein
MKELTLYSSVFEDNPVAVPCLKMSFYITERASECALGIARIIRLYAALVPAGAIQGRVTWNDDDEDEENAEGEEDEEDEEDEPYIAPFDIRDVSRIEAEFQPHRFNGVQMYTVWLLGSESVRATGYSVTVKLSDTKTATNPKWLNYVELTVPVELVKEKTTAIKDFFVDVLETVDCRSANCGLSLDFSIGVEPFIRPDVRARMMRFIGLDSCYEHRHSDLGAKLSHVSWLTYLKDQHLTGLFNEPSQVHDLGDVHVEVVHDGMLFRTSALPALGDLNRGATDVGALPTLSRILSPFVVSDLSYFKWMDAELAERWVNRLTDVAPGPWDNTLLVPY